MAEAYSEIGIKGEVSADSQGLGQGGNAPRESLVTFEMCLLSASVPSIRSHSLYHRQKPRGSCQGQRVTQFFPT